MTDRTTTPAADGSPQSLDQMANWVRFADTKATILTAGLGVVLTMLMTNAGTIAKVLHRGDRASYLTASLAGLAAVAVCYTLFWLVRAIGPRRRVDRKAINRFAWPTLVRVEVADLLLHTSTEAVTNDAWQQVLDLANLADRKFGACAHATRGFACLVLLGVACIGTAMAFSG